MTEQADENQVVEYDNPVQQKKPLSIETALIYGENDRFYNLIDQNYDPNVTPVDE